MASLHADGPFGPYTVEPGSCSQTVNVATAQHTADRFGAPVAWIPGDHGIEPSFIHASAKAAVEDAQLGGSPVEVILVSAPH